MTLKAFTIKLLSLLMLIGLTINACKKKDDESAPANANASLSGNYEGIMAYFDEQGNEAGSDPGLISFTLLNDNIYSMKWQGVLLSEKVTLYGSVFSGTGIINIPVEYDFNTFEYIYDDVNYTIEGSINGSNVTFEQVLDKPTVDGVIKQVFTGVLKAPPGTTGTTGATGTTGTTGGGSSGIGTFSVDGKTQPLCGQARIWGGDKYGDANFGRDNAGIRWAVKLITNKAVEAKTYPIFSEYQSRSKYDSEIEVVIFPSPSDGSCADYRPKSGFVGSVTVTIVNGKPRYVMSASTLYCRTNSSLTRTFGFDFTTTSNLLEDMGSCD